MNWIRLNSPPIEFGEGTDGHGLGETGNALHEDVTAGQQRDDQPFEQVVLADDDLLDLVEQSLHRRRPILVGCLVHSFAPVGGLVRRQTGGPAGHVDGHGKTDADEDLVAGRVEQRGEDPDDVTLSI